MWRHFISTIGTLIFPQKHAKFSFICRNIRSIPSLAQFPNLTSLSIDGNHLQDLDFIRTNYALAELYAGNNHISNIQGTFRQLKNLRVLHLQNNQISNLTTLAYELRHLSALEDLSTSWRPTKYISKVKFVFRSFW